MNFWQHIVSYFKRANSGSKGTPTAMTPRRGGVPLWYGNTSAMSVATVFRCVKLLSESVANLPLQYLKMRDGIFVDAGNKRLNYLLNVQPDIAVNAFDFWRQVVQELLLDGNAYIVPVYNIVTMELDRLALCERGTVAHDTLNDTYNVHDPRTGISGMYNESEIIHFKGLTLQNVKHGVSVLTYARLTLDIASTGDQETQSRFANGGAVRGIVSNDSSVRGFGEYQDQQLKSTAADLNERFAAGERIVNLPGQVDFKQISLSSTDMQFLESRKFTVREICRFFGVHPSFVFDDTSNNYKSAEQANVAFLSHTLNPLLRNIEVELLRKLIAPSLAFRYKFQFDRRDLRACDMDGLMRYRTNLLQTGTTINEVRAMNNLPAVEGGDTVLISANLRGINDPAVQPQPNQSMEDPKKEDEDGKDKDE